VRQCCGRRASHAGSHKDKATGVLLCGLFSSPFLPPGARGRLQLPAGAASDTSILSPAWFIFTSLCAPSGFASSWRRPCVRCTHACGCVSTCTSGVHAGAHTHERVTRSHASVCGHVPMRCGHVSLGTTWAAVGDSPTYMAGCPHRPMVVSVHMWTCVWMGPTAGWPFPGQSCRQASAPWPEPSRSSWTEGPLSPHGSPGSSERGAAPWNWATVAFPFCQMTTSP
jgi:hypothetical protein